MRATSAVLLALLSVVGVASAQTAQTLPRGTRVRITPAASTQIVVGRLIAVTDSAVVVRRDRGDLTIPRWEIQQLEVSRGTSRAASAGWGALIGLGIGGAIGVASWYRSNEGHNFWVHDARTAFAIGGILGTPIGTLIGFAVGFRERWRDTAVPVDLSIVPTGRQSLAIAGRIVF
jgi:hypothetical protein